LFCNFIAQLNLRKDCFSMLFFYFCGRLLFLFSLCLFFSLKKDRRALCFPISPLILVRSHVTWGQGMSFHLFIQLILSSKEANSTWSSDRPYVAGWFLLFTRVKGISNNPGPNWLPTLPLSNYITFPVSIHHGLSCFTL
jgi:hypothetical protein